MNINQATMPLIDSHCHLDFAAFDQDREAILRQCRQLGINSIIVPGVTVNSWPGLIAVCKQSDMLYPTLGLHPMFMHEHRSEATDQLAKAIEQFKPVAVGEIGLDYYLPDHDKQAQLNLFTEQIKLARQYELPVILHVRKAHDEVLSVLRRIPVKGGIVHAFSGSEQQAHQYQKLGFLFGIGGAITYPRATRLRTLVAKLPLNSLALETDAPDMPLHEMNGSRNTPENIIKILSVLTSLRNESQQEIASVTTQNVTGLLQCGNL